MPNRILTIGIDPSLSSTGIVAISQNILIDKMLIKTSRQGDDLTDRIERYKLIVNSILSFINKYAKKYGIIFIGIEGYSYASKGNYGVKSGELGGLIRYALTNLGNGFTVQEIAPKTAKRVATGNGNADKETVKRKMIEMFKLDQNVKDDITDALAVAISVKLN